MAYGGLNREKDASAGLGRNPVSKHQIQPEYGDEQADAGRTAEPVSRDHILRHEQRGQGNIHFPCSSADHEQDWQPYSVNPYPCYIFVTIHNNSVDSTMMDCDSVCVCVCVFIKLHITAQSGLAILVILCHSH